MKFESTLFSDSLSYLAHQTTRFERCYISIHTYKLFRKILCCLHNDGYFVLVSMGCYSPRHITKITQASITKWPFCFLQTATYVLHWVQVNHWYSTHLLGFRSCWKYEHYLMRLLRKALWFNETIFEEIFDCYTKNVSIENILWWDYV